MLPNTLVTNEVKNAAGVELEFSRIQSVGRTTEFKYLLENPGFPLRLKISHQEAGSGTSRRRRSVVRFDQTSIGGLDNTKTITHSCYIVADIPVGNVSTYGIAKDVLAYLLSFCASLGASTTILYDGTGNGAVSLVNGDL